MIIEPYILKKYNKKGLLKKPLSIIKDKCIYEVFGHGTQVITFLGKNENEVYKLSPMNIGYLNDVGSLKDFVKDTKSMGDYVLPVKRIVYKDENVFIYIQKRIEKIKKLDSDISSKVLRIIYEMMKKDLICTDIRKGNIGYDDNNVVLFDIQGLRHYNDCSISRLESNINIYLKNMNINERIHLSSDRKKSMKYLKKYI